MSLYDDDNDAIGVLDDEEEARRRASVAGPTTSVLDQPENGTPSITSGAPQASPKAAQSITGPAESTQPATSITASPLEPARPMGPASQREHDLLAQGPPQYHGAKKVLDILGRVTGPGAAIEQRTGLGTLGYESRLGEASLAAAKEQTLAKAPLDQAYEESRTAQQKALADQEQARAKAITNPPVKQKEEEWSVVPNVQGPNGEPVQQEKNSGTIRLAPVTGASVIDKTKPEHQNDFETYWDKSLKAGTQDTAENFRTAFEQWNKAQGKDKPQTEPGNYQPVTDARGNTVGWVDPKSGHFKPVSSIAGVSDAAGGGGGALPRKPTGQEESRLAQAEVVTRAGTDLITQIDKNRSKLGNVSAIINSAFLGTPLSDPVSSEIAAQLASFAALNPAMHGFRGTDALREFEKLTGKIANNPDSMIAAIKGILRTASAFDPNAAASGATAPTVGGFAKWKASQKP